MYVRLGAAVLALVALAAGASAETVREESEATLDAAGLRILEVENARGLIEARVADGSQIRVRALKVVRAPDREKAAELARELKVEVTSAGDRKVIRVRYPQRQHFSVGLWDMLKGEVEFPRSEIRLTIEVPERLDVRLHSTSGDVVSDGLAGVQTLESTSGDVSAFGARGRVIARTTSGDVAGSFGAEARLRTVSGDIEVESAGGSLDASSTSGQVLVGQAADSLLLGTVSGDIEVDRAARGARASSTSGSVKVRSAGGMLDLRTSSGDIHAWLGPGLRGARIESSSGDVEARVSPALGISIEVRTSNGTIDSELGLQVTSASRRLLSGTTGNGAVPVRLSSSSGDIQITSGGE